MSVSSLTTSRKWSWKIDVFASITGSLRLFISLSKNSKTPTSSIRTKKSIAQISRILTSLSRDIFPSPFTWQSTKCPRLMSALTSFTSTTQPSSNRMSKIWSFRELLWRSFIVSHPSAPALIIRMLLSIHFYWGIIMMEEQEDGTTIVALKGRTREHTWEIQFKGALLRNKRNRSRLQVMKYD